MRYIHFLRWLSDLRCPDCQARNDLFGLLMTLPQHEYPDDELYSIPCLACGSPIRVQKNKTSERLWALTFLGGGIAISYAIGSYYVGGNLFDYRDQIDSDLEILTACVVWLMSSLPGLFLGARFFTLESAK